MPLPPIEEDLYLQNWSQATELTNETETSFMAAIGNRILAMKDFPGCNVAVLVPREIAGDLMAISHRWDSAKMTYKLLCIVDIGDNTCYYWRSLVEFGLDKALLQIPDSRGRLWMDQLCIPQHVDSFKGSQIQFMGQLYTNAISVISGSNAVSSSIDRTVYNNRAWTQQEFSFGKVSLHPRLNLSIDEKISFIVESFKNCEALQGVLSTVAHHAQGMHWQKSHEMCRIESFDEQLQDHNPALKTQVHELWEAGWVTFDKNEIYKLLSKFRAECKWNGSAILGPGKNGGGSAFKNMFYCDCYYPKDQLFGMMGAPIFSITNGQSLDYMDVEGSYLRVMELLSIPLIIGHRDDGDGTGMMGYLTPLKWRDNKWDVKYDIEECKRRDVKYVYHIPTTLPQCSQFGHHFKIKRGIDVWSYQRDNKQWLSFGFAEENKEREGTVFLSVCTEKQSVRDSKVLIAAFVEESFNTLGNFCDDSQCNWRFRMDFLILLESLEDDGKYNIGENDAYGWTIH